MHSSVKKQQIFLALPLPQTNNNFISLEHEGCGTFGMDVYKACASVDEQRS